jgi:predicted Zn-dependent protease
VLGFSQEETQPSIDSLYSEIQSKFNPNDFGDVIKDSSLLIQISSIGNFDSTHLYAVSKRIEEYFGFKTILVNKSFDIKGYFIKDTEMLNAELFVSSVKNDTITIYVTNHILYTDRYVMGVTAYENLTVLLNGNYYDLKNSSIHELGHIFGLHHCENEFCIMNETGSTFDLDKFCNNCLKKMYE